MNKDVIYVEPEDDITDIITKLKAAKQKVVALVPPKKASVFRSAVNIKLISKSAKDNSKLVVFVTTDSAIMKLAMASRIPVAPNLQTRPIIPKAEDIKVSAPAEVEEEVTEEEIEDGESAKAEKVIESDEIEDEDSEEDAKAKKKAAKEGKITGKVPTLDKYRKWIIIGSSTFIALILFLVWAFVFAPHATINVKVRTTAAPFSETVTFTTKESEVDNEAGKFYIDNNTLEKESETTFEATGRKNTGNKASGSIKVAAYFSAQGSLNIDSGTTFTFNNLVYVASAATSLSWNGEESVCENRGSLIIDRSCRVSVNVSVVASGAGAQYNIDAANSGWASGNKNLSIVSASAMAGGTDNFITVVQQSDIDKAKESLKTENESDGKKELIEKIGEANVIIDESFAVTTTDPIVSPKLGEEVKEGVTPTITAKTTFSIFSVDLPPIRDFINKKANIGSDEKVYAVGEPYFERFAKNSDTLYSARLKTDYEFGPKITEESILELVKGRKIGEVSSLIKGSNANGVSDVNALTSFFWVTSVPNDPNKITINLTIQEK